jgi:CRP-like cAMP-binding protein
VALKGWFGARDAADSIDPKDLSTEELIVLERYEEAEKRLLAKLKSKPGVLRNRLKLAEVYEASGQTDKAVAEYITVADSYSADGFHDKGRAVLSRAVRLRPLDDSLQRRLDHNVRAKQLELSRVHATQGLMTSGGETEAAVVLRQYWNNLAKTDWVRQLNNDQLQTLFSAMKMVKGAAGRVLGTRGSRDARLFLILNGAVEAVFGQEGGAVSTLRQFTAGDIIGEGCLLEHRAWPATYRISEASTLFYLEREGLEKVLMGNPDPLALLTALRQQGNDRKVAAIVAKLERA